jgi:hypothetical protein
MYDDRTKPDLLSRKEAAEFLSITPGLLAGWTCKGVGPKYIKLGDLRNSPIRYERQELMKFLGINRIEASAAKKREEND